MCGICGVVGSNSNKQAHVVDQMALALSHRGPDGQGREQLGFANFGHRRLSVIDLSSDSSQPFTSECQGYMLSFNGEIYNYQEIRSELSKLGHRFRSNGDAEVLLTAYIQWGISCLQKLNGMFAFAIWDQGKRHLLLARDRMGEKPLYYSQENHEIIFASEPRAISKVMRNSIGRIDILVEYLYLNYNVSSNCLQHGLKRLAAGSLLLAKFDGSGKVLSSSVEQYWAHAHGFHNKISISERDARQQFLDLLQDSVKLRMISDRSLGCLLSGGLDSSAILSLMAAAKPEQQLRSYTTKFSNSVFDESHFALDVAKHIGSQHAVESVDEFSPARLLNVAKQCSNEPFADGSFLAMQSLCRFASNHVTVGLTGDGADEILAGYPTMLADQYANKITFGHSFISRILRIATDLLPLGSGKIPFGYKLLKFAENIALPNAHRHQAWRSIFSFDEIRTLLAPEYQKKIDEQQLISNILPINDEDFELDLIDLGLLLDQKTWLPENILIKSDRASMAHGLELRAPFLDYRLVEFSASLPTSFKIHNGQQ